MRKLIFIFIAGLASLFTSAQENAVDDVKASSVYVPSVDVPQVYVPQVYVPDVEIPQISGVVIVTPKLTVTLGLPDVVPTPQSTGTATVKGIAVSVSVPSVDVPILIDYSDGIPAWSRLQTDVKNLFRDRRNMNADASITPESATFKKWLDIYKQKSSYTPEFKELPQNLRMIAEVRANGRTGILKRNLSYYRNRGYNAALVTFYGDEDTREILELAEIVKSFGLKVFFAYSGAENLRKSVFNDPDRIADILRRTAALSDGFVIGWRRTSAHLFLQDAAFVNFMLENVRKGNPQIPFLGEAYFGHTGENSNSTRQMTYNVPANSSGVLVAGTGYNGVNARGVMNLLKSRISGLKTVALVTGDRPYYMTANKNHLSFSCNQAIKEEIETRFLKAGFAGTATLHGDGSDGVYNKDATDNLSITEVTP